MATLAQNSLTMFDLAKLRDPDGSTADIVEMLAETNAIIPDMRLIECNNQTLHKTTRRASLPKGAFRRIGEGVDSGKSTTIQVTDATARYETTSIVDEMLLDGAAGDKKEAILLSESRAFLQGMNNDMAKQLFYASKDADAAAFDGLFTRFARGGAGATDQLYAGQILNNGGTGSALTSMALCVWGDDSIAGLYPKGSVAGLQHEDKGKQKVMDGTKSFWAYHKQFIWNIGLCIRDPRQFARLANIDYATVSSSSANLSAFLKKVIELEERIANYKSGSAAFYCNKRIFTLLRLAIHDKVTGQLTWETVAGSRVMMWNGIPVRCCDEILNTEAEVLFT
jgi:hypothetical protein